MSWLSDIGHKIGSIASNPWVEGAAGILGGPLAGAAVGGLGHLMEPGGNLGSAVGGAVTGGLAGTAGGAVRKLGTSVLGMMDGNGIDGQGGNDGLPPLPGQITFDDNGNIISNGNTGGAESFGGLFPAGSSNGGGGWQNALTGVLGGVRKLGSGVNAGDLAIGGLAAYQGLNAANASKRAGQLSDKALALAENRWGSAAPLREAGQARLLNPTKPDLSAVYTDTQNPFAVRKLRSV